MKIHLLAPNPNDATSFYRAHGPFSDLRRRFPNIEVSTETNVNSTILQMSDVVVLQRPFSDQHVQIMKMCQDTNTPLILDYDDLLTAIPEENKVHHKYADKKIQNNIKELLNGCSLIFCATKFLAHELSNLTPVKCVHIPNACQCLYYPKDIVEDRKQIILWRGTDTHSMDLYIHKEAILSLMDKYSDWLFIFMGFYPFFLNHKSNFRYVPPLSIHEYFKLIDDMKPAIMWHPLQNNDFNHAKSMCAWLEATYAGAAFIGINSKEHSYPGIIQYESNSNDALCSSVHNLIAHLQGGENEPFQTSRKYIKENLTLAQTNALRLSSMKNLILV